MCEKYHPPVCNKGVCVCVRGGDLCRMLHDVQAGGDVQRLGGEKRTQTHLHGTARGKNKQTNTRIHYK